MKLDNISKQLLEKIAGLHEIADGHALVDQSGRRKCIKGCGNDGTVMLLGQLSDRHGHGGSVADHNASRVHFDGAQLGFVTVAQDH